MNHPFFSFTSIPVLVYHKIGTRDRYRHPNLSVTHNEFKSHLQYLYDHDIVPITLDQYAGLAHLPHAPHNRYIAITFDDGYLDNYQEAFPLLHDFRFVATVFLITSLIGKNVRDGNHINRYMDKAHIEEMQRFGISFQSHTCTHPSLPHIAISHARYEITHSKYFLEDLLGRPVCHLAYPLGRYNDAIMSITSESQYLAAYTAGYSKNTQFSRERFNAPSLTVSFPYTFNLVTHGWGNHIRKSINAIRPSDNTF